MALLPLDLETTGLEPTEDRILEVSWAILHDDLTPHMIDAKTRVITPVADTLDLLKANPFVLNMHTETGLAHELTEAFTVMLEDVEDEILSNINAGVMDGEPVYLLGASVHFDLNFIRQWMPRLAARLSHRVYDTSTLKAFFGSLGVEHDVVNAGQHRALNDVLEVIEVARFYRNAVSELLPTPGQTVLLHEQPDGSFADTQPMPTVDGD